MFFKLSGYSEKFLKWNLNRCINERKMGMTMPVEWKITLSMSVIAIRTNLLFLK